MLDIGVGLRRVVGEMFGAPDEAFFKHVEDRHAT